MATTTRTGVSNAASDPGLRRALGFWHLTGIALGGILGSGWLLTPMYAAQEAGPAALLTWVIAGIALVPMALVLVELGASYPMSGGLVRWPFHSSGRLVGTFASWCIWLAYATNPPGEATAAIAYLRPHWPWLYHGSQLAVWGYLLGLGLMGGFVLLNWFGVRLFARFNLLITVGKIAVPTVTALALLAAHFDRHNLTGHGGLAPNGYPVALTAVTTAGAVFAFTGFQAPLDFAGEATGQRRDIPRAVATALLVSLVLYVVLQLAFLGAIPQSRLVHGWSSGINQQSTYLYLAKILNLFWLSMLLSVDAVGSPAGSALVYTAEGSRAAYAMGLPHYGLLPRRIGAVHTRSGIPRNALAVNFLLGACFLVFLRDWPHIIAVTSILTLLGYSISLVSAQAIRRSGRRMACLVPGVSVLAPASFTVTALIFYWSGWDRLHYVLLALAVATAVGYCWHAWEHRRDGFDWRDLLHGLWLVGYLAALAALSKLGSFHGADVIAAPYDSILVAATALLSYFGGLGGAERHLRQRGTQRYLDGVGPD